MSDFGCLKLFATSITVIDAMMIPISGIGLELIIGARILDKSIVAVDSMIDQDACYWIYALDGQEALVMAQVIKPLDSCHALAIFVMSGADESADWIYGLNSWITGKLLAFAAGNSISCISWQVEDIPLKALSRFITNLFDLRLVKIDLF